MVEHITEAGNMLASVFIGIYVAYKFIVDKKRYASRVADEQTRHGELTTNQLDRIKKAGIQTDLLLVIKDNLAELNANIEMMNGFKTGTRVSVLKNLAYGDQKNYWIKELTSLFHHNGFVDRAGTIDNIMDVMDKTVKVTDRLLRGFLPCQYLASTNAKCEFLRKSSIPNLIYETYLRGKLDESLLAPQLGSIYDKGLGLVLTEFYDDDGRVYDGDDE